jgi:hypothetical protein
METDTTKSDLHILERIEGTRYPYYSLDGPIRKNLNKIKSVLAPINPFSYQQVPSKDRFAFMPSWHSRSWKPDPAPNPVQYETFLHLHSDPLEGEYEVPSFNLGKESKGTNANFNFQKELFPLPCIRSVNKFKLCKMLNGEEKCETEGQDILQICPNFILDQMRNNKLQKQYHQLIQKKEYNEATTVSDYNQGRSIQEVADWKRYIHGTRAHLRPDTIWADERYINVTQEEIDAAKVRHQARIEKMGGKGKKEIYKRPPISQVYSNSYTEKPLYS